MIKKAKTKKNIFSILSAILGVVFAFITGVTYCVISLNLSYQTNLNSTDAFLGNQQYVLTNDTIKSPIVYGEGSRNFEISMQYAIDYDFDIRLTYEMEWSNDAPTTNVVLNFANRDNVIYDNNYIFLAQGISKGEGKITFITGVEFVNTNDPAYYGANLTINITDVKIYKQLDAYNSSTHVFTKNIISSSIAAQAWINFKTGASSSNSYAIMYNYRRNFDAGVPYVGLETAYKKPTVTYKDVENGDAVEVSGATWLGGNKTYAGTGMYVITGNTPLKLQVEVAGIWRVKQKVNNDIVVNDVTDSAFISENSIRLNYSSDWKHSSWDDLKLWETTSLVYEIPQNTTCYINILESIEIISASRISTNLAYDSYRAVINSIVINPGLTQTVNSQVQNLSTSFTYSETNGDPIQLKTIVNNSNVSSEGLADFDDYHGDLSVVNTSLYSQGLYNAIIGSPSSQTFNTNISLINNTEKPQVVNIQYNLMYYISNGNTALVDSTTGKRASEKVAEDDEYDDRDAFVSSLYHSYSINASSYLSNSFENQIVIAPYSSVNLVDVYTVSYTLQAAIATEFTTDEADDKIYYDVWTYLNVTATVDINSDSILSNLTADAKGYKAEETSLAVETVVDTETITVENESVDVTKVTLKVKNISTKIVKGVTISNVTVKELKPIAYELEDDKPADWDASYWKYYTQNEDGSMSQVLTNPITEQNPNYKTGTYYLRSQTYTTLTTVKVGDFTKNEEENEFTNSDLVLNPGESVEFATATADNAYTKNVFVAGFATANLSKDPSGVMLVNSGTDDAYLINHTENSYFVRFSGGLSKDQENFMERDVAVSNETLNYIHFIGILRPGQIVKVSMDEFGEILENDLRLISGNYSTTTLSGWNEDVVNEITKIFALNKTNS